MRIAVAADERSALAQFLLEELSERGHEAIVHGALADGERADWAFGSAAAAQDVAAGRAEQFAIVEAGSGVLMGAAGVRVNAGAAELARGLDPAALGRRLFELTAAAQERDLAPEGALRQYADGLKRHVEASLPSAPAPA